MTHEVISDGSIWFGKDSRHTDPATGEVKYDFNTDETVKFPSAVALLWRWTGDNAFRDAMYDFSKRNLRYVVDRLDEDGDGWPEGSGNVERGGMGVEKLDNSVYLIRGLYDLADMARSKNDGRTYAWARNLARKLHDRFEATWWMAAVPQHADSIDDPPVGGPNNQQQDQHWIGVTPMEAELTIRRGRRARAHHARSRQPGPGPSRDRLLQRPAPVQPRPVPHRLHGRLGWAWRAHDLRPQHSHSGGRRGELRPPRPRPAAALHRRGGRADVR